MKVLIVSHAELPENSGIHVDTIGFHLSKLGADVYIATPRGKDGGSSRYTNNHVSYGDIVSLSFHPDVVHAWTTRAHVSNAINLLRKKYEYIFVIHHEDNEWHIANQKFPRIKNGKILQCAPYSRLKKSHIDYMTTAESYDTMNTVANGLTFLVDQMKDIYESPLPTLVFSPSSQLESLYQSHLKDNDVAKRASHSPNDVLVIGYSGTVHDHTLPGYIDLQISINILLEQGYKIHFIKTGFTSKVQQDIDGMFGNTEDLGFVNQVDLMEVIHKCDVMILPCSDPSFDNYRFPSKIPDYFCLNKPFLIPDSNIAKQLPHSFKDYVLEEEGVPELCKKILHFINVKQRLGSLFFSGDQESWIRLWLDDNSWQKTASRLLDFYARLDEANISKTTQNLELPVQNDSCSSVSCLNDDDNKDLNLVECDIARIIAFYLPQFHPIPENDLWWGKGFTEWRGVGSAISYFSNHRQPRVPTDLGYYDLRLEDNIANQVRYAQQAGVYGFCFYYYWFNGKRLLESPLSIFMKSAIRFPFCICWANETWSRRWDGSPNEILIEQKYDTNMIPQFCSDLAEIMRHANYIRINGSPLLVIYNAQDIPDSQSFIQHLREYLFSNEGIRLHISIVQSFKNWNPFSHGCDSSIEFTPYHFNRSLIKNGTLFRSDSFDGFIEDYLACYAKMTCYKKPPGKVFRCVFPQWDNTPRRREKGHIIVNCNPITYAVQLFGIYYQNIISDNSRDFIFLNAWNEWGEGSYLEPDNITGNLYAHLTMIAQLYGYNYGMLDQDPQIVKNFLLETIEIVCSYDTRLTTDQKDELSSTTEFLK